MASLVAQNYGADDDIFSAFEIGISVSRGESPLQNPGVVWRVGGGTRTYGRFRIAPHNPPLMHSMSLEPMSTVSDYHKIFDCCTDNISYVGCMVMPFLGGHGQGSSRGA